MVIAGLASFVVLVWLGSGYVGIWWAPPTAADVPSLGDGVVSGVFVAGAACASMVTWRAHAGRRTGWVVATGTLVATQSLLVTLIALQSTPPRGAVVQWLLLGLGLAGVVAVAAWLAVGWLGLRRTLEEDRRRIDSFERDLVDATRDQRERLHELRSTVAGLVSGSALLDRDDLPAEARVRLWASVRRELDRMERMLSGEVAAATDLSLDDALGVILDLQRLKGRQVQLLSSGDVVRARFDALAEVVNILMDNAVKHGGTDSSVVEVVRRDDETVDITVTDFGRGIPRDDRTRIFEWGGRASEAPGEGIGLHVAQRLMTEDGGSLRLADRDGAGSSFVISLPAARRSPENDLTMEDGRGWRRSG